MVRVGVDLSTVRVGYRKEAGFRCHEVCVRSSLQWRMRSKPLGAEGISR